MITIKLNWNRKYTTIATYSLIVIILAVLFVVLIFQYDSIAGGIAWLWEVFAPILLGLLFAYILNPLVNLFENKVFKGIRDGEVRIKPDAKNAEKRIEKAKARRKNLSKGLSVAISLIILLAVITGIFLAVFPNIAQSIVDLANHMPTYVDNVNAWLKETFENNPEITNYISQEFSELENIVKEFAAGIEPMAGDIFSSVSTSVVDFVSGFLSGLKNVVIGLIIAVYFLCSKERLLAQMRKLMFALFSNDKCQGFFSVCKRTNKIFTSYIISNLLDSCFVFVAMSIVLSLMGMPYAILISAVCAVTDLIPFFGPFIGAIPCGFLILLVDPVKVIWFAIFVLVLQQFDGNIFRPFLMEETMGLPAIWVLISIILGGGLFGIPGMLLGTPVFTVIYMLFSEFLSAKLKKKKLPTQTEEYFEVEKYDAEFALPEKAEE